MIYLMLAEFLMSGLITSSLSELMCEREGKIPLFPFCEYKMNKRTDEELVHNFAKFFEKIAKVHKLQAGETVGALARKHNLSEEQIYDVNPGLRERASKLQIGEEIVLPESAIDYSRVIKHQSLDEQIQQAARWAGVDPAFLKAMLKVESGMNQQAKSEKGAQGLGQLMPMVQKMFGITDPEDTAQNIAASAAYISSLLKTSPGDTPSEKYWHALMQYNWGPGNFSNWVKTGRNFDNVPAETKNHTLKVYRELGWQVPRQYVYWYVPQDEIPESGVSRTLR